MHYRQKTGVSVLLRVFLSSNELKPPTHKVQSNLNSSNTDGSFTMANSNSVLSPYEILPLAQENNF